MADYLKCIKNMLNLMVHKRAKKSDISAKVSYFALMSCVAEISRCDLQL